MKNKLNPITLEQLQEFERQLKHAIKSYNQNDAETAVKRIKKLLTLYGDHHRLLEAQLHYFEFVLDSNHVATAESGLVSLRRRANPNTRLYLEATFLLGVCDLRRGRLNEAKVLMGEVIDSINKVRSDATRRHMQTQVVQRAEEEAVLCSIIGSGVEVLNPERIHSEAVALVQSQSESAILEMMASSLPQSAIGMLHDIRNRALHCLPCGDRKFLPGPSENSSTSSQITYFGKRVFNILHRITWRTVCDSESPIYKVWSKKYPEIYNAGFFSGAVVQTLNSWKIGLPVLATGLVAILLKSSAVEFCSTLAPDSIMSSRRKS
jgi:hypothetical protein